MIVGLLPRGPLERALVRATPPEEDLVLDPVEVRDALDRGFTRLLVRTHGGGAPAAPRSGRVPELVLAEDVTDGWDEAWRASGIPISREDFNSERVASLVRGASVEIEWIERLFRELGRLADAPVPPAFRAFIRPVLEFPARYPSQQILSDRSGLTANALGARFRRRGLATPFSHLRWARVLVACHLLSDPTVTVRRAAYVLGHSSGGNFCRAFELTTGRSPSEVREGSARTEVQLRFAEDFLDDDTRREWEGLGELFGRKTA